ncbi:Na+/H+ antiporter NhaC family protein [Colwellia sp. 6_MG-2023]|uniref:Na+/H+ antiporter NhaC family protein n=1 Tax=Colwellia sp. 6_MG-2023 TaxID=3062676 RepID=UPI0026E185E1|nr:Na+/H+ antiporter NhaC family protein [Colwellia sp. 6_MG-2023]MDO6488316.1 Na+/H+ antiporter NhaC family protein [Colwellia sp. 6_MG-2023]
MEWYSLLPPLVAVLVVLWKKEVILALLLAIITSEVLLAKTGSTMLFDGVVGAFERIVSVFGSAGNTRILLFSLIIGAVLAFMRHSGGVTAMVEYVISKGLGKNRRQAAFMANFTGMAIFIESNLSVLTAGIVSRGLFDRYKMSRATLAYIIDSSAAPICILVLLNGWGAFVLGLLSNYEFEQSAAEIMWGTIALNFYPIIALMMVWYTAYTGNLHGPLARSKSIGEDQIDNESNNHAAPTPEFKPTKARFMFVPLLTMVLGMIMFMFLTGDGTLANGSGSKSVLYATVSACLVAYIMMLSTKKFTHHQLVKIGFDGMSELLPLVTIVLLSLTLGASLKVLGTGVYVAQIIGDTLPLFMIAPMLFIAGAVIAFSTGTSWGTFAILIPIGVPLIQTMGLPPSFIIAAILGGGVFGDHCSPISDTTAVSAIASGCELLEHVKTQLPYALFGGALTIILYAFYGIAFL